MQDPSSLTGDGTCAPCGRNHGDLTTGPPREFSSPFIRTRDGAGKLVILLVFSFLKIYLFT